MVREARDPPDNLDYYSCWNGSICGNEEVFCPEISLLPSCSVGAIRRGLPEFSRFDVRPRIENGMIGTVTNGYCLVLQRYKGL